MPLDGRNDLLYYQSQKVILKEMSTRLAKMQSECRVKYVWFGYVGTEKTLSQYPHFTTEHYITEDAAVNIIAEQF
jgi:hypothetical protein